MAVPHRSVAQALERLAGDVLIADDGPHVAIVLGVNPDRPPSVWFADRDGHHYPIDALLSPDGDESPAADLGAGFAMQQAPFTLYDVVVVQRWLCDFVGAFSATGEFDTARRMADAAWRRYRDAELNMLRMAGGGGSSLG
jgi:hypothetical protein